MNLETLIELCQKFRDLGDSVGGQLADVIEDPSISSIHDQNGHALRIADREFLEAVALVARDDGDQELLDDIADIREAIADASTACRDASRSPATVGHRTAPSAARTRTRVTTSPIPISS